MTVATAVTTASNIQFPFAPTPALGPETPQQPQSSQHIIRLLQNNPHLSHLLPNSLLIPNTTTAVTTATAPFVDANADISRTPEVPTAASLRFVSKHYLKICNKLSLFLPACLCYLEAIFDNLEAFLSILENNLVRRLGFPLSAHSLWYSQQLSFC